MFIEHLNLVVTDIERSLKFYQAAFPNWTVRGGGKDEWHGKARRWIHLGDEQQYLAFSDHGEGENRNLAGYSVGLAHFAFSVSNLSAVIERLRIAGFQPSHSGNPTEHRNNIYFVDPDGFEVEFVEYRSDIAAERNNYN